MWKRKVKMLVAQSCLTLCNSMDCSPPVSFVQGVLQVRILEWVVSPFSRGSSQPRNRTGVSCIPSGFLTSWATREAQLTFMKKVKMLVAQSCLTLRNPMDYTPLGFSVPRILQARILEWVAISFSRGSSQPRDWTQISCIAGRFFTIWPTRASSLAYIV